MATFVAAFAVADLIGPPILVASRSEFALALFLGTFAAQIGLLAIWAVLRPQRWVVRLPVTLAYAALFYTMLIMGMTVAEPFGPEWPEVARTYLFLPLVFLAVQSPLWILRIGGGYRIVRADPEKDLSPTGSRQFHLQHLFVATGVVAVSLGLASLGVSEEGDLAGTVTWGPLLLVCLACAGWSAFSTLPCLWAGLVARHKRTSTVVMAVYVLGMTAAALAIASASARGSPPGDAVGVFLLFHVGLVGVMLGVLHAIRHWGYVLRGSGRPVRKG